MAVVESDTIKADNVTVRFGGLVALDKVSVAVRTGSIVGLMGPNGAGKTTMLGVMSGFVRPSRGAVCFCGEDVTGLKAEGRARRGMSRTFQRPELFDGLTVKDHLLLADRIRDGQRHLWRDLVDGRAWRNAPTSEEEDRLDFLLKLLDLVFVADQEINRLPLGQCRLVEIGRALATCPKLILLDEPASGLDPRETELLTTALRRVSTELAISLLLVEHDVEMVLGLADEVYVLDFGRLLATGTPDEIRLNDEVRQAYLGESAQESA